MRVLATLTLDASGFGYARQYLIGSQNSILCNATLERHPCTQLDLPSRCRALRNCAELRRIYEAVRSTKIRVVEGIEEFPAELEFHRLRNSKVANNG